ncbi:glutamate synthase large subunit [Tautonia plasticadhaerens]|uniref:Glutamate synthase [NADPH] large chain n=1 Tax=Tautonia plasticadhaerens TaxID=2527974 RepID=A0A518H0Y6_9BACT|nr:glutamate synthase large subunit [Tautonia plasticadhaerens]QDV34478.1 Ferredoxin-dependent glutamate synthase 1 [Tautonia plasticadhaerens]
MSTSQPPRQGLYDPALEHDACGVGFVVDLEGRRSFKLVRDGLRALCNLDHRGARGCEPNTGDGAGILIQIPHEFLRARCAPLGIDLPGPGRYGVGAMFASPVPERRDAGKAIFEKILEEERLPLLGWRELVTDNSSLGATARAVEPGVWHAIVGSRFGDDTDAFERKLFVVRKRFEHAVEAAGLDDRAFFYFSSLSCRTLVYKGMLTPEQVIDYYADDLGDERVDSALCMFHSRFSTNTFPSWELAHPYRMIAHNGEINTLRGNINWMRAREALFASDLFEPGDLEHLRPVIREGLSDTASLDAAIELLVKAGYSLPHAMMMLVPEAWENHETMSREKKDFYAFHSCLMEPWDGPASIACTDGRVIGATLDRNGLRPSRYTVTKDGLVVMGSETGMLDEIAPEDVVLKGRLEPGKMFLVDMEQGLIVGDEELKHALASAKPYGEWVERGMPRLSEVPRRGEVPGPDHDTLLHRQLAYGYTLEDLKYILSPMGERGEEAIGSMGTDTPLAVLSDRPQPIFNYFKQLFAQVTNPPLDAIREELVTSVLTGLGGEGNLLAPGPENARQIRLDTPVLDNDETEAIKVLEGWRGFKSATISMLFPASEGAGGMARRLEEIFQEAKRAIEDGANIIVLSHRSVTRDLAPIPSLLATSGLHHFMVREGLRMRCGFVVECGDAREVHHFALLLGYGAGAINPYVAFETLDDMIATGYLRGLTHEEAVARYRKAIKKGVVKVMSKMGISTIQSYRGAQIFEAIGLNSAFVAKYFDKTASRIEGIGLAEVAEETLFHHRRAFAEREVGPVMLEEGGQYQWRRDGEFHLFNPETVFRLQHATKAGRLDVFKSYSKRVDEQNERLCTLRGLFEFKFGDRTPVPIEEVEPVESIVRRFATGAMSYGSISAEAHETLAIAMNRLGGKSNTGEGGENPERFTPLPGGDSKRSAIKQVASGRFGVTSEYLVNADEIQIKMAQGAKPGEGGQLPGHKVWPWIAKVRFSTPGVGLISPPPHHDIYSIEDLAQLIHDLKNANPRARISVKLVAEVGVGTVAAGVSKAHSDVVLISGFDGGTGASPLTSLKHAGIPWELGLAETQQTLVLNNLRDRIVVQADGQMKTGRDVVIAALLGAEEYGFATAPLVVMGCIMMRVCHLDTCPVGIATQNPKLRAKFAGKADHVVNYFKFVAEEIRGLMAQLGFRTMDEMIGRSDALDMRKAIDHYKAKGLDFSKILHRPETPPGVAVRRVVEQDHGLDRSLDQTFLVPKCEPALERGEPVAFEVPIRNINRTVGTILGSEVTRRYGGAGLPDDTIHIKFDGSAGQSFGAFVPRGITLELEGDANDYTGKGLSGGKVVVYPPREATFKAEENILVGNVVLYGATAGRAFFRGRAGERFCVRNSGALAVVEGIGDHGCEYMTGGVAVVLGPTGRNFAAGMSGGMAFVLDEAGDFRSRCNAEMVDVEPFSESEDLELVRDLLIQHAGYTGSVVAARVLNDWDSAVPQFVKVMPRDYRRVLDRQKQVMASLFEEATGLRRSRGEFELDDLRHKAEPNDFAFVEDMLSRFARPATLDEVDGLLVPRNGHDWDWPFTNFVKVLPEGNRRLLLERKRLGADAAPNRPSDPGLTLEVNHG